MNRPPNNRTRDHQRHAARGWVSSKYRRPRPILGPHGPAPKPHPRPWLEAYQPILSADLERERELECLPHVLGELAALDRHRGRQPPILLCYEVMPDYRRMLNHYFHVELVAMARGLACSIRHHRLGGPLWRTTS